MKKIILTSMAVMLTVAVSFSQSFSTSGLTNTSSTNPQYRAPSATYAITQSTSMDIISGSVSCNNGGLHTDNYYSRVFDLVADFGINEDIEISSVDFGIETASGNGGTQPAVVNIYTLSGAYEFANLTLIATESINIPDQTLSILNVPTSAIIPAGSVLVVEVFTPNGQTDGNSFFIGSNNLGQTGPSYLAAPVCGVNEPSTTADIGFPDMHIVMVVNADPYIPSTPIANWAIVIGLLLIGTFIVVRYRTRLA
jgi:hypothetical protein